MPLSATNSITADPPEPVASPFANTKGEANDNRRGGPGDERADVAGWPWSHPKDFLERLAAQGYAVLTIQEHRTIAGRFCDAIEKRRLRIGDLNPAATERLRHAVLSVVTGSDRRLSNVL
jgi:hypothetical protein